MEERVDTLVPYGYADVQIATFHAFGDRLIKENALELGLTPDFRVLTRAEQIIFLRDHLFEFPLKHYRPLGDPTRHLHAILTQFSRLKDEDVGPDEYLAHAEELLAAARRRRGAPRRRAAPRARAHLRAVPDADGPARPDRLRRPDRGGPAPLPHPPARPAALPEPLPVHPGGRVPGHQLRAVRAGQAAGGPSSQRGGGGRRRPGHLPLPRRVDEQHPRLRPDAIRTRARSCCRRTAARRRRCWTRPTGSSSTTTPTASRWPRRSTSG